MKISILTLFPEMFKGPFDYSIIKRAIEKKLVEIEIINIRDFGIGKHKIVDDKPYGGGSGMLLKVDVVEKAIAFIKDKNSKFKKNKVILLDPKGKVFSQKKAKQFSRINHLIFLCAHYEGVDERIRKFIDEELSIGDYILTGGELPAMVAIDAIVRLIPNALGKEDSSFEESFKRLGDNLILEYPQYTRPKDYKKIKVPKILFSGNHKKISEWRKKEALKLTKEKRPDLLKNQENQKAD